MVPALCARSLGATLAAAVSTLALFGAADWGFAEFVDENSFITQLLLHSMFAFAMPLLPLQHSLRNALSVWCMKQRIHNRHVPGHSVPVDRASIAIFSICPLYIQVPKDFSLHSTRGYNVLNVRDMKPLCPLELSPREAIGDPHATDMNTDHQQKDSAAHDKQKKYLALPVYGSFMDLEPLQEKGVLLTLGLVPEYSQLRFLRSRSRFQALVTGFQAGGYVFNTVQRLAQHLAVCPLEAIICFLSVIIILQLLLELYACSHYQRPLLLHLNQHQFSQFWDAPRDDTESPSYPYLKRFGTIPYVISSVLVVMLFSGLSIYYSVHYIHSCVVCSVAALLFCFSLISWVIGFQLFITSNDPSGLLIVCWIFSLSSFLCSIVLAVLSTAKHWDLFESPIRNSFSWILPHVSS